MTDDELEGMVLVARYESEQDAREATKELVEHGLGARFALVEEPAADETSLGPSGQVGQRPLPPPARPTPGALSVDDQLPSAPPVETPGAGEGLVAEESQLPAESPPDRDAGSEAHGSGDWGVYTMSTDVRRAGVLLQFAEPDKIDDPESELDKPPTPWGKILAIWLVALIVIPAAAGLITFLLIRG